MEINPKYYLARNSGNKHNTSFQNNPLTQNPKKFQMKTSRFLPEVFEKDRP